MTFVNQTEVKFPEVTFCPEYFEGTPAEGPMAYNKTIIEECGIKAEDLYKGWYYGSKNCSAEQILEKVHPRLEDFNISYIQLLSGDGSAIYKFNVKNEMIMWKEWFLHGFGKCFTMTFPEEITKSNDGVSFLSFDAGPKHFRVYLHSSGLLGWPDFETGVAGLVSKPGDSHLVSIEQEYIEYLDTDQDECNNDLEYNRDECVSEHIRRMSDCLVPYGSYHSPLCQEWEQIGQAYNALKQGLFKHTGCPIPCQFITHSILSKNLMNTNQNYSNAVFWFKPLIKKSTSRIPYGGLELLGEVGGYVGLFLGLSVFQVRFLIDKIIARVLRNLPETE